MVMSGALVSLRYSPAATARSSTFPERGDFTVTAGLTSPGFTPKISSRRTLSFERRLGLLECRFGLRQRRLRGQHLFLRNCAPGVEIARTIHISFGFRHRGL